MNTVLTMLLSVAVASPALAAADPSPPNAAKPEKKKDRVICRSVQETGSRMGNIRMCMSAAAWRDRDNAGGEFENGNAMYNERLMSQPKSAAGGPN
jgi:hypothetical protein